MSLPIRAFKDAILASVAANPVTIVVTQTGAGKTTQIPQYLVAAGYYVLVTQPRRLAAISVAERVAHESGCALGSEIGFAVGGEAVKSSKTRCLFATEGLALMRELNGNFGYDVLVLDEVHEWHQDMEILIALAKKRLAEGAKFKLVLMSATVEAEKLSDYFGGAPIITVPGRTFPVEVREPEKLKITDRSVWAPFVRDIDKLVQEGRTVLAFVPGKGEIAQVTELLSKLDAVVLPLHGELDKSEQAKCFQKYEIPKVILSTNIAQTSLTIDDVDAVLDSGLERRTEVENGVEGLRLRLISRADAKQREGRAGRCKNGISIDHAGLDMPGIGSRENFPTPEIRRVLLDQAVLRLAVAGLDLEDLPLFHPLAVEEIEIAKKTLRALGCLGVGIQVTDMGKEVARLPIGVRTARMLIEARKYNCVREVAIVASIIEAGGIVNHKAVNELTGIPIWHGMITDTMSDHIAQLRIYERCVGTPKQWKAMGLHGRAMRAVGDSLLQLSKQMKEVKIASRVSRDDIVKSIAAGLVDQVRQRRVNNWGETVFGVDGRKLDNKGVIKASTTTQWVVGKPWDIPNKNGGFFGILTMSSVINIDWIVELAPHLIDVEVDHHAYDDKGNRCRLVTAKLGGQVIRQERHAHT